MWVFFFCFVHIVTINLPLTLRWNVYANVSDTAKGLTFVIAVCVPICFCLRFISENLKMWRPASAANYSMNVYLYIFFRKFYYRCIVWSVLLIFVWWFQHRLARRTASFHFLWLSASKHRFVVQIPKFWFFPSSSLAICDREKVVKKSRFKYLMWHLSPARSTMHIRMNNGRTCVFIIFAISTTSTLAAVQTYV